MCEAHYDGMSSDDEVPDLEAQQYKAQLAQIKNEATLLFEDVEEDYCEISHIKRKFEDWKQKELNSYKEAFVNLCLPKIFGVVIRSKMILWNPFDENYEDVEKTGWFHQLAMYGKKEAESEECLRNDPDLFLIPSVIEKILLPKLTSKLLLLKPSFIFINLIFRRTYRGNVGPFIDNADFKASRLSESTRFRIPIT